MTIQRSLLAILSICFFLAASPPPSPAQEAAPPAAAGGNPTETAAEAPSDTPSVPSLAGRWYSYYGIMEIEQDDAGFRGTYGCCQGEISGRFQGRRIDFTWKDAIYGQGWGHLFVENQGRELKGLWGEKDDMGESGEWGAVRIVEPHYLEPGYEGEVTRWRIETEHQRFGPMIGGELELAVKDKLAEGRLEGHYMTEAYEQPFRVDVFLLVDGTVDGDTFELEWEDPRYGHYGEIHVTRQGSQLAGEWEEYATVQRSAITLRPAAELALEER